MAISSLMRRVPDLIDYNLGPSARRTLIRVKCFGVSGLVVIIKKNALGGAFDVLILAVADGPEEAEESQSTEPHCREHEEKQAIHFAEPLRCGPEAKRRRRALRTTMTDEDDMA